MTPSRTGPDGPADVTGGTGAYGEADAGGRATSAMARLGGVRAESGQMMVLLIGLVGLILMVLGLGWDASNWFLGHRALNNLADGAAIAAASDIDLRAFYASDGRRIELSEGQAAETAGRYLSDVAGDSGVEGVRLAAVRVERRAGRLGVQGGPQVTVELQAVAPVAFLRLLHLVGPVIEGHATATAEVVT